MNNSIDNQINYFFPNISFQGLEEFYGGDVVIQKTDVKSSTIKNPQIIAKTK